MRKLTAFCGAAFLYLALSTAHAQSIDSIAGNAVAFPGKLLGRIQSRVAGANDQLTRQTQRYLAKMARREDKLRQKLAATDSTAAKNLFGGSAQQYADLSNHIQSDSGSRSTSFSGTYHPYLDSLQGSERILGAGYSEIAPGVFRSADGLRQFRMTASDLNGVGFGGVPHVHIETYSPGNLNVPVTNYHIPLIDP
jgi:membrane-bound lytic murein transglycosylase